MVTWYILRELSICSVIFWTFIGHTMALGFWDLPSVMISLKSINIC